MRSVRPPRSWPEVFVFVFLLGLLLYVAVLVAEGRAPDARAALLRASGLLAAAVCAVSVPHVLLPDPQGPLLHLLNASPRRLLAHQLRRWGAVVLLLALPTAALALADVAAPTAALGRKALHALSALLTLAGVAGYAFVRYMTLGQVSQAWQEGRRGGWYRRFKAHRTVPLGVPDGLVPALLTTAHLFAVGALTVAASGYALRLGGAGWAWLPGGALAAYAAVRLLRVLPVYDRHFYATNAFYAEVFRSAGGVHAAEREPVTLASLYWVPARWRAHVWAALRQLDRKLPLGRMIALAHLGLWTLYYQDASAPVTTAYLLLLLAAQNAAVYLLATPTFAPPAFQRTLQRARGWVATRFFVNLRWTFPLAASLLLVAFFDDALTYQAALGWTALDLLFSFLTAALVTYAAEVRYRKQYA